MGVSFFEALEHRATRIKSHLCVGIDPHPEFVSNTEQLLAWSLELAEATAPAALCFKVNIAFFEAFGAPGISALEKLIPMLKAHAPLILDAKRGDIGSTAAAYAAAVHDRWNVEALTVNPYLGFESIEPYLAYPQAGLFLLCHTSNAGAAALQRRVDAEGQMLFEWIAEGVNRHPERRRLGLVVGATQPDAIQRVRTCAPESWILAPGVGAQGGSLEATVRAGWGSKGRILISASRSIARAEDPHGEALRLRDEIESARAQMRIEQEVTSIDLLEKDALRQRFARLLIESSAVLFGDFTLKSGLRSPFYLDLRRLGGHPEAARVAAQLLASEVQRYSRDAPPGEAVEALAGLPLAGLPLAANAALLSELPLCYPRAAKAHGTGTDLEGAPPEGSKLLLIDDLITRGTSALELLPQLRVAHRVDTLLVLIDRQAGGAARLEAEGMRLISCFQLIELIETWEALKLLSSARCAALREFLDSNNRAE